MSEKIITRWDKFGTKIGQKVADIIVILLFALVFWWIASRVIFITYKESVCFLTCVYIITAVIRLAFEKYEIK